MEQDNTDIPYAKYACIFVLINSLFFALSFFSYVLPELTLKYYIEHDPAELAPSIFFLFSIVLATICLLLKKQKAALIISLLPEMTLFALALVAITISLIR